MSVEDSDVPKERCQDVRCCQKESESGKSESPESP